MTCALAQGRETVGTIAAPAGNAGNTQGPKMTDKKTRITMIVLHDQAAAIEQLLNTMILATLHDADDDMSIILNRKSQLRAIRDLVRNFKRSVYQPTAEALEDWNDDLRSRDDEAIRE